MKGPILSVIIPTFNEEKFLPILLRSLAHQNSAPYEVIVVDGASTDKTIDVARPFKKSITRFQILSSHQSNVSVQRNLGASSAKGDWLVFIDADSIAMPYFTYRIAAFIQSKKPTIFTSWFKPDSDISGDAVFTLIGNLFVEGALLFHRPIAPGPLTVVKKESFETVGGYDISRKWGEDYDLTKRIVEEGMRFQILRETLFVHSLRRARTEGRLKFIQTYAKGALLVLLTNKNFKEMPGYITGGQNYGLKKKTMHATTFKKYERLLKKLVKELLG